MWSIGQWVQVNPDPDTEDIYDWYTDLHFFMRFSVHAYTLRDLSSVKSNRQAITITVCLITRAAVVLGCTCSCVLQDHVRGSSGQLSQAVVSGQR